MPPTQRTGRDLIIATRKYAHEHALHSWWSLLSTLVIYGVLTVAACLDFPWPVRVAASLLAGLVMVRLFVLYHDYQHGAILRKSVLARWLMTTYGLLAINPPSIWNRSHNHHHKNNSKSFGANIGSYPLMTTTAYRQASRGERLRYLAARHWLTMLLGYLTVFLYGMCLRSLLTNPRRHFDSAIALVLHATLVALLAVYAWDVLILAVLLPFTLASALGAYLFYAQHSFPAARIKRREDWDYVDAALHSSSFMRMGHVMRWFTGNIGFHHVHHLNSRIPFYRLPEAMADLEELQQPRTTSLHPGEVIRCLRLKLWDADKGRLVTLSEAAHTAV